MRLIACIATAFLLLASCDRTPEVIRIAGETMGTTYHVTVVDPPSEEDAETLRDAIEAKLAAVNGCMSTWDPDSEISRFNAMQSSEPMEITENMAEVVRAADAIHALSHGKFDITLGPLIDLWGFGEPRPGEPIPSDEAIAEALEIVGQARLIDLKPGPSLAKRDPRVRVNLSAIAKGYGIDQVAAVLAEKGIENYLVEIGGDLVASGQNPLGDAWVIGIERPDAQQRAVEMVLPLTDLGAATSGDYRNFFEEDGVRYSHIIDPTTGRPVTHRTTSVTVVAKSAMLADGLATALLATGERRGIDLAEENNIAALFIVHDGEGFVTRSTSAFEKIANLK
ncbi:FAD:protein FMN transferase [Amaricoccus macauensis]|uniref:FAD:protein FMN transferase n=1 Tax=Amaricoccus macauensis TaxID=57001 RepID=UPI003C7BAE60